MAPVVRVFVKPADALLWREWPDIKDDMRILYVIVVDLSNARQIGEGGGSDDYHFYLRKRALILQTRGIRNEELRKFGDSCPQL